jgi:hypothetical protein
MTVRIYAEFTMNILRKIFSIIPFKPFFIHSQYQVGVLFIPQCLGWIGCGGFE